MSTSFKEIMQLNHNINTITNENLITVFKEEEISHSGNKKNNFTKYVECSFPFKLNTNNKLKCLQGIGAISILEWSFDSKFLATKYESLPNVVFVWEMNTLKLHTVIVQLNGIKNLKWSPKENILLIVTDNSKLYTFTLDNVYIIELVSDMNNPFNASNLQWASDGKSFIVSDKKQMLIGHPTLLNDNQQFNPSDGANSDEEEEFQQKGPIEPEQYYPINNNKYNNINSNDMEQGQNMGQGQEEEQGEE